MVSKYLVRTVVAAVVGAALLVPATANAYGWHRHHHRWHHHHWHMIGQAVTPVTKYGEFPNVVYFKQGGHTYARNIEDNYTYIVK